ncbi:MAG: suppressor of fused domain protein [Hyphomonadaceae bacterium]
MDLEEVWRIREEERYPALFGAVCHGIFPLTRELFEGQFKQSDIDPKWLHYGVFEFEPTPSRPSWLYVTSGHSNPWHEAPSEYRETNESGVGAEFTFATSQRGDWAIRTLQSMLAFDILLWADRFQGKPPLSLHDKIPLRAPINGDPSCVLRNLIVTEPEGIADEFTLPSGKVLLVGFTAVSDAELTEARTKGSGHMIDQLRTAGFHPINDPARKSLV